MKGLLEFERTREKKRAGQRGPGNRNLFSALVAIVLSAVIFQKTIIPFFVMQCSWYIE